jgi:HD-GYP domain-containing protein (c-di-GMP phosphodiesterase class II)
MGRTGRTSGSTSRAVIGVSANAASSAAMTTTRSYRKAMPVADAVAELRRCSGTQFDPAAVEALLAVIAAPGWELTVRESAGALSPA